MSKIVGTIVVLFLIGLAAGAGVVYGGVYDVGATARHWPITYRLMETARIRSIKVHAADIVVPAGLGSQAGIVDGTSHFAEHCASCHSAPGVEAEDMADGMYPQPPVLTEVHKRYTPAELFWILKHGIKMSGMPSWADHGDAALWNIVAFLEKLPELSPKQYADLVVAARAAGGHHMHGGTMDMGGMNMSDMNMRPDAPASQPGQPH